MIEKEKTRNSKESDIAIIGMSGRFPGANDINEFWNNIKSGKETISFFTIDELRKAGISDEILNNPNYVPAKGIIKDYEYFDNEFFGYSPREATIMDPQIRIFHQCVWNALEDAGYCVQKDDNIVGLFAGATTNFQWLKEISSNIENPIDEFNAGLFNSMDYLTTLISYKLNLKGPSISLQTACSTSLVAVDLACKSLLNNQCNIALAGGISITYPPKSGYVYYEGMINSPDGHCRAFDKDSKGCVFSHGVGVIVLKKLKDAIKARDNIYAVIKGSHINNDGLMKIGFTAPSQEGQVSVIREAQRIAGVNSESISYIEAHGTGTKLGDMIEIESLKEVFSTEKRNFCAIGSVKANIGHLNSAAGIAGIIKVALSLKHSQIPPSINYSEPNPNIDFRNSPFFINNTLMDWKNNQYPLRAGVSSFGIGGTNAHIVLEEYKGTEIVRDKNDTNIIILSAKTEEALELITNNLCGYLKSNPDVNISDLAYTLQVGRMTFEHKRMFICSDIKEAINIISDGKYEFNYSKVVKKNIVFMFSGQGIQYINMGLGLYNDEPLFRIEMDRGLEIIKRELLYDIKSILYPEYDIEKARSDIREPLIAKLSMFVFQYSLACYMIKLGIKPSAMVGYGLGEYVAACLSGVLSFEAAIQLIYGKVKIMSKISSVKSDTVLKIKLSEDELKFILPNEASILISDKSSCVISGTEEIMNKFYKKIENGNYRCKAEIVSIDNKFKIIDTILKQFETVVKQIKFNMPCIPYISSVTGQWITLEEIKDMEYWTRHLLDNGQFEFKNMEILNDDDLVFIEVGFESNLGTVAKQYLNVKKRQYITDLIKEPVENTDDMHYLLSKIGLLWLNGVEIDWGKFYKQKRNRISLPLYPFKRNYYWINESNYIDNNNTLKSKSHLVNYKNPDINQWFYVPLWKQSKVTLDPVINLNEKNVWIIFEDQCGIGEKLGNKLGQNGDIVFRVKNGKEFSKIQDNVYVINPLMEEDFKKVIYKVDSLQSDSVKILFLWGITKSEEKKHYYLNQFDSFYFSSALYLAKALDCIENTICKYDIIAIANNMYDIESKDLIVPDKSMITGICKVIAQEYQGVTCRSIDIKLPETNSYRETCLINQLIEEVLSETNEIAVAYRENRRWTQIYEPLKLDIRKEEKVLTEKGVYLILGGLGYIGLILAEFLSKNLKADIILIGHSSFPKEDKWDYWIQSKPTEDLISKKIKKIRQFQSWGSRVKVFSADISNFLEMQNIIKISEEDFGRINGVIHAAGITGSRSFRTIKETTLEFCNEQFASKVNGMVVIEKLLQGRKLDFCMFISSLSAILGGVGYTTYASANLYLDAFISRHNKMQSMQWIGINFDGWLSDKNLDGWNLITPEEGVEVFRKVFSLRNLAQLVVSTGNLSTRIDKWIKHEDIPLKSKTIKEKSSIKKLTTKEFDKVINVQNKLISIWEEFFGIELIGIEEDFFELGGDSLEAINLLSRISKEFNVEILLAEFFENSNIKSLAEYIQNSNKINYKNIRVADYKEYYNLSSAQKRVYIESIKNPDTTAFNETVVYIINGKLDFMKLENALKNLIERHEALRTSFIMVNDEPVQKIHKAVEFNIERKKCNESDLNYTINNFIKPYELSKAPLMRVAIVEIQEMKHALIVDMHHIVTDRISQVILLNDFISFYKGNLLPALKLQYKDYAEWQNSAEQKIVMKKEEEYWIRKLQSEIKQINIPTDYRRPSSWKLEGGSFRFNIDKTLTERVKEFVFEKETTLYILFLSVINILLAKYTGQDDIIVGSPITGRGHPDLEGIIGMFVNMMPIRSYPSGYKTINDFLYEEKENSLKSFENSSYQFDEIVNKLGIERKPNRNPIFDVVFSFQNQNAYIDNKFKVDNLEFVAYEFLKKTAQFDLLIIATDQEDTIDFVFEYPISMFKKSTAKKIARHYIEILEQVLVKPNAKINEIIISTDFVDIEPILNEETDDFLF